MKKDKEITITDIANRMDQGFKANDSKFDELAKTINDLASSTADGFLRVDKRFDEHDQRFDQIENEIKTMRAEISFGFREINREIRRLDGRIDKLLKMTNEDISSLVDELNSIKLRIKKLELKNS